LSRFRLGFFSSTKLASQGESVNKFFDVLQDRNPSPMFRVSLVSALVAVDVIIALTIWLCWDFLCRETARMPHWQVGLMCFGDILAVLSFNWFMLRHGLLGRPFAQGWFKDRRQLEWWLATVVLGAVSLDLIFSGVLLLVEEIEFAQAIETEATVHSVELKEFPRSISYAVNFRFGDQDGNIHSGRFAFFDVYGDKHSDKVFESIQPNLVAGKVPFTLRTLYLADRPQLHRLKGHSWWDDARLPGMLIVLQLFQFCGVGVVFGGLVKSRDTTPWWWEFSLLVPLIFGFPMVLMLVVSEAAFGRLAWVTG
jgi:hypothetical protein